MTMSYPYLVATVFSEIFLPVTDAFSDIYLCVQLILNGHPLWSLWVLFPVIVKTIFTVFACKKVEKRNWIFYTPLVLLQIYPQFCILRALIKWSFLKAIDENTFWKEFDYLEGCIGFLHVIQAVPQGFVQTAFFAVAHFLPSKIKRFCYNEKIQTCKKFDNCTTVVRASEECPDDFGYQSTSCNQIEFEPYKYNSFEETHECEERVRTCNSLFESCLQPFYDCILRCESTLNDRIVNMDERDLMNLRRTAEGTNYSFNFLSEEFGATKEDLKNIQLDLLYARNEYAFLFTYTLSVIAAIYGITKFFRLSYSRHCDRVSKRTFTTTSDPDEEYVNVGLDYALFGMTCTITGIYLTGKGVALSRFMWMNDNTMGMNVVMWLVFFMLPSVLFALFSVLRWTCEKSENHQLFGYDVYKSWMFKILFKEPAIFGIPCVSPFMYKVRTIGCTRNESIDDHKMMHCESEIAFFELSYRLSSLNNLVTILMGSIGLITYGHVEFNFVFIVSAIFFLITSLLLFLIRKRDDKGNVRCFEHGKSKSKCPDCAEVYGVHIKDYQNLEVCKAHQVPDCSQCTSFLNLGNSDPSVTSIDEENGEDENN